jgi:hypothetical protein
MNFTLLLPRLTLTNKFFFVCIIIIIEVYDIIINSIKIVKTNCIYIIFLNRKVD